MIWEQPLGIAAIPNNRYLGIRYVTEDNIRREEVYTGEFLILALDSNSVLRGKVLDYDELECGYFKPFAFHLDSNEDDNEDMDIVNHVTKDKIDMWIATYEDEEYDNPIELVLDAIYSHVYKNLHIDDEAEAYLKTLKKEINYKGGNE